MGQGLPTIPQLKPKITISLEIQTFSRFHYKAQSQPSQFRGSLGFDTFLPHLPRPRNAKPYPHSREVTNEG